MQYRKLSEQEIQTLVEEHAVYERWRAFAAYAARVYGSRAARIAVDSDLVYNDETDDLRITELKVFDAHNRPLDPDLSTDWWQTKLGEECATLAARPWDEEEWNDPRFMALYELRSDLPVPPAAVTFDVRKPPARRFPRVYAPVDENGA